MRLHIFSNESSFAYQTGGDSGARLWPIVEFLPAINPDKETQWK
jgi:hypothetical protein